MLQTWVYHPPWNEDFGCKSHKLTSNQGDVCFGHPLCPLCLLAALPRCPSEGVPSSLLTGQTGSFSHRQLLTPFNQMLHQKTPGIQVMLQAELVCIICCYFWTKTNCLCVFWVTDANRELLWAWMNTAAQPSAVLLSSWVPIYSPDEAAVSEGSFTRKGDWMQLQLVD